MAIKNAVTTKKMEARSSTRAVFGNLEMKNLLRSSEVNPNKIKSERKSGSWGSSFASSQLSFSMKNEMIGVTIMHEEDIAYGEYWERRILQYRVYW
ncbi:hypothetical protein FNV43_RR20735 [Rhamnella rubrinervis]|uniref:Uncharacterized protein n=1 Tax=Rhamnella rubrinervis TaxID=2594499 RepID=A0A8K0GTN8_9ROSA|nr:hypothetical protein FNV43_RR20735 [Rhamnella rubrinervis]